MTPSSEWPHSDLTWPWATQAAQTTLTHQAVNSNKIPGAFTPRLELLALIYCALRNVKILTKTPDWLVVNSLARCKPVERCDWLRAGSDQECTNYLSRGKPGPARDQAFNCDKFFHLTFVPAPLKLKQSNMNETNSLMEASGGPESFMLQPLKLKRLLLSLCRQYCLYLRISPARAVGWTIMRRDNNNTNINICPHYVSSRELRPVNRTESKHRPGIVSIISSEDNCHLAGVWSPGARSRMQGPGDHLDPDHLLEGIGPPPPVRASSPDQPLALWSIIHARHY